MINYLSDVPVSDSIFLVPLVNIPQNFNITLAGISYLMTCKWNDSFEAGWVLDIYDAETTDSLVANIPLIVGADLLSGLDYLGINGQLFVYTNGSQFSVPTLDNLGVESNLYFTTSAPNV